MMRILDRYIVLNIASATFFVMLILVALFTFFTFAGELNRTGKGNYDSAQALQFALLTIPSMLYQLFPTTALIGTITGLGVLANNSELIAMRSIGYSLLRILRSVFLFSFVLMIAVVLIGEYFAPATQQYAETRKNVALSGDNVALIRGGIWWKEGNRFIRVGEVSSSGRLHDISIYELNDELRLKQLTQIDTAINVQNARWLLSNYNVNMVQDANISVHHAGTQTTDSFISTDILDLVSVKPEAMSAQTAYQYIQYLEENGIDASHYAQAFWMKVTTPLATFVMVLLAIPMVLGSVRAMSAGHRILIGTLIGIGFYLLSQVLAYVGLVFELQPALVAFTPIVISLLVSVKLMKGVR